MMALLLLNCSAIEHAIGARTCEAGVLSPPLPPPPLARGSHIPVLIHTFFNSLVRFANWTQTTCTVDPVRLAMKLLGAVHRRRSVSQPCHNQIQWAPGRCYSETSIWCPGSMPYFFRRRSSSTVPDLELVPLLSCVSKPIFLFVGADLSLLFSY